VVGRLVEQQHVGLGEQQLTERHAAALAARERVHDLVARRQAKRVHGALDRAVDLPGVGGVDLVLQLAYVDQSRDALDSKKTVWEEISGGEEKIVLGKREVSSRAYVANFNFTGSDQQKKVGELSGGERNRVHLAKLVKSGGNVLLLDEPTNDLDVDTLRNLEEALEGFAGCAVIISRSEERRVGKECRRLCRSRWSPYH
jgi:ATPase subunit of ABC transporter with duplicated ATPase domains